MKEVIFHLENGHPIDQHIDEKTIPISAFFTMAHVVGGNFCQFLAFGNSSDMGQLLMSFYETDLKEGGLFAAVMEQVAEEILERKKARDPWPGVGDGRSH